MVCQNAVYTEQLAGLHGRKHLASSSHALLAHAYSQRLVTHCSTQDWLVPMLLLYAAILYVTGA